MSAFADLCHFAGKYGLLLFKIEVHCQNSMYAQYWNIERCIKAGCKCLCKTLCGLVKS